MPSALRGDPGRSRRQTTGVPGRSRSGDDRLWYAPAAQGRVVATPSFSRGHPLGSRSRPWVVWVAVKQPALLIGYDTKTLQLRVSTVNVARPPVDLATDGDLLVVVVR